MTPKRAGASGYIVKGELFVVFHNFPDPPCLKREVTFPTDSIETGLFEVISSNEQGKP